MLSNLNCGKHLCIEIRRCLYWAMINVVRLLVTKFNLSPLRGVSALLTSSNIRSTNVYFWNQYEIWILDVEEDSFAAAEDVRWPIAVILKDLVTASMMEKIRAKAKVAEAAEESTDVSDQDTWGEEAHAILAKTAKTEDQYMTKNRFCTFYSSIFLFPIKFVWKLWNGVNRVFTNLMGTDNRRQRRYVIANH